MATLTEGPHAGGFLVWEAAIDLRKEAGNGSWAIT